MDLDGIRALSAHDLTQALDELGIENGWAIGDAARAASIAAPDAPCLPSPEERRSQPFENLVVGTIVERIFRQDHLALLEPEGFSVVDYHRRGEHRDFGLQRGGVELPINVKVASTLFRKAKEQVGLEPDDCIPIPSYKAVDATEKVPALVYVDLVAFDLRERVDAFMGDLEGPLGVGWHLLSWYRGRGSVAAQNKYIDALFDQHGRHLAGLLPDATSFRVISAQRVLAIMRNSPKRVPGLGIKAAGRGAYNAEVNIHISVRDETRPWDEVADQCRDCAKSWDVSP